MPNENTFKYWEAGELVNEAFPTATLDFLHWDSAELQTLAYNIGVDFGLSVFDLLSQTEFVALDHHETLPVDVFLAAGIAAGPKSAVAQKVELWCPDRSPLRDGAEPARMVR